MAKRAQANGNKAGNQAPPSGDENQDKKEPAKKAPKLEKVSVILRKPAMIANEEQPAGTQLAEITLAPGVSLNYLVDAVRCDLAGRDKGGE
ncbi:MAG: hypothetical protein DWQ31_16615 [Planctomycetota bacterium]|nr:MAG: hypothetical protein DWQ31_16615 [Planctomycetota bacterium]